MVSQYSGLLAPMAVDSLLKVLNPARPQQCAQPAHRPAMAARATAGGGACSSTPTPSVPWPGAWGCGLPAHAVMHGRTALQAVALAVLWCPAMRPGGTILTAPAAHELCVAALG